MKRILYLTTLCAHFGFSLLSAQNTQSIPLEQLIKNSLDRTEGTGNAMLDLAPVCPADPCPCTGGFTEVQLYYFGVNNVSINVYRNSNQTGLITSFVGVNSGQLLIISGA